MNGEVKLAEFHFVEDYERRVSELLEQYPLDEAMSWAVGGEYDRIGIVEVDLLRRFGLSERATIVDIGCGSGRLAKHLGLTFKSLNYMGFDIVQSMLDYARTQAPSHFEFLLHKDYSIPAESNSCDMVCAFSVFTHLLHEESYTYILDAARVLKQGGLLVFSFLEFRQSGHWSIFERTRTERLTEARTPINVSIEREVIDVWAARAGFVVEQMTFGPPLGQSVAVLRKI